MDSFNPEVYDLLILVDATYSMSSYLESLQISLPQIVQISTLTDCFSRIGLLAYRDYCDRQLLEWSGWMSPSDDIEGGQGGDNKVDLIAASKKLTPIGGGDGPEATKTGLARAYELMREDATTIVLLYTDAPCHTPMNGKIGDRNSNLGPEQKALSNTSSYGGYGPRFKDWVSASKMLSGQEGGKKAQVFCILQKHMLAHDADYYNYLSTMTGGASFFLSDANPMSISKVTIEVLLSWMGAEKAGTTATATIPAIMARYISLEGIEDLTDETASAADKFFWATAARRLLYTDKTTNVIKVPVSSEVLKKYLPKKANPMQDFAKRYNLDPKYKKLAIAHLTKLIEDDVIAISINPVFGSLWRAVCNDRDNEERDTIIANFGLKVDKIANVDEKARMKSWLEESYDYTAEVMEAIESVPELERYPCVFLDPTLTFTHEANNEDGDAEEANENITKFRREDLLEIGRSCDYRILRRLSRVLTQLSYVNSAAELPNHIAATPETEIPRIPMALAHSKYKRKFWRILLHIVVPGTMLGARPAALLAALSIRLGLQPLLEAANVEMLLWTERWNNIEIPETWNMSCLSLLMDADKAYRERLEKNVRDVSFHLCTTGQKFQNNIEGRPKKRPRVEDNPILTCDEKENASLLKPDDLALFQRLVSYKMLELNLDTTLTAQIGWTPEKTKVPMGPHTICVACNFPRSITIMGAEGRCGLCHWNEQNPLEKESGLANLMSHVTKNDNETTLATWVECNLATCRAQYVVYEIEHLNVKPKCHYCRMNTKAPILECSKCLNRVIYPEEYRTGDMKDFKCYACTVGRQTTVECKTTAKKLSVENTNSWLMRNDSKDFIPLNNRSLFHTISTVGTANFCDQVELFPNPQDRELVINGKLVRNVPALITQLQDWVLRRKTELANCMLCEESCLKKNLHLICGRSGCTQRTCDCVKNWYGTNAVGRIINPSALSCPCCRRAPTAKTLAKNGNGIHMVANLRAAVDEAGKWIYAWCVDCDHAKRYMERICAGGAPAVITDWSCEECAEKKAEGTMKRYRECPGCEVMTERISGCNHIACRCGTHWCWYCGGKSTEEEIYHHMLSVHGSYIAGQEEQDLDDGLDDDDGNEDVY